VSRAAHLRGTNPVYVHSSDTVTNYLRLFCSITLLTRPSLNMTVFWDIAPCSLEAHRRFEVRATSITGAVRTSETSVYFNETTGCFCQKAVMSILADVRGPWDLRPSLLWCLPHLDTHIGALCVRIGLTGTNVPGNTALLSSGLVLPRLMHTAIALRRTSTCRRQLCSQGQGAEPHSKQFLVQHQRLL
jgi:hypothetical protein